MNDSISNDSIDFPVIWIESGDRLREILAIMPDSEDVAFFCRVNSQSADGLFFVESLVATTDLPLKWWDKEAEIKPATVSPGTVYLVREDQPWQGVAQCHELLDPQTSQLLSRVGVETLLLDRSLHIQAFTKGAGEAFCLMPHDVGRPLESFRHQFRDPDLHQQVKDALRYHKQSKFEIQTKDDRWHWMCLSPQGNRTEDEGSDREGENVGGIILTFTEISSIRESGIEMEQSVRRRDEFLAMLSHELRNPLAAVISATHVLNLSTVTQPQRDDATQVIQRQTEHLSALLDDLLDVARVTQGKIHVRRRTLDIKRCAELAIETVRPSFDQHQQPLEVDLPEQSIWVDGSFPRLQQVFINLLKNASKYSGAGKTISLSATQNKSEVCVRIRDQGIGISDAQRSRVFDMFMQNDRAIDRSDGGMGVGLTLVKSIVDLHDGTIRVESEGIGKGSEFIVTLPLSINASNPKIEFSDDDSSESSGQLAESAAPGAPQDSSRIALNGRVVLVEDNDDARNMLVTLLRDDGLTVAEAVDGQSGYDLIESVVPDVALIDIGLPRLNGHEVISKVKANSKLASVHCIALTGYGQMTDREHALGEGFDDHLVKPVNPRRLTKIIRKQLESKRTESLD